MRPGRGVSSIALDLFQVCKPVDDRTRLLTDRGSGYLARAFEEYLRELKIRHIYCALHHPQTVRLQDI